MKTIIAVLFVLLACSAFALTEIVDGITWNFEKRNNGSIIGKMERNYTYGGEIWSAAIPTDTEGDVVIPQQLGGCPVMGVGSSAFQYCTNMTSVVIPNTVTNIGGRAFSMCSISNIVIGASVRIIGTEAFDSCSNLTRVVVPDSVKHIERLAFYKCTQLRSLELNEGLEIIDDNIIVGDSVLKELIVPTTVFRIYDYSFVKNTNDKYSGTYLTRLYFKGNMPEVWDSAFGKECNKVAFYDQSILERMPVYCVEGNESWSSKSFYGATIKNGSVPVSFTVDGNPCLDRGTFAGVDSTLSINCINHSATIYYTLDGTEPTTSSIKYKEPIAAGRYMVKAIAVVPSYPYTITETCDFALGQVQKPSITMIEGSFYLSKSTVALISETENAAIRYTLDGSEPTEKSALYTVPFTIDDTTTVKAKAFKTDWFESETATATFTREWYTVDAPDIMPGDTIFANASQEVSIGCATEGATILYTIDGSDPAVSGHEYKRPFKVYNTCTVRAVAIKYDWKNSEEATATMTRGEPLSAAANLYGYKMGTDAERPWVVDTTVSHDGVSSIRSNGDGSYVQTSVNGKGTLSFWWRAMCEEPGYEWYDHCAFVTGGDTVTRIAGEDTGWVYYSMTFSTLGKHVLRWEYHKDEEGDFYPDCVWVDQVQWVPADGSGYTVTTPEPVPYSWLMQHNLGVAEGDFEAAGNAVNGKMSWGRPMSVWQDYVAGTDPTNLESMLTAKIEMQGGIPLVTWEPNLNTNGDIRVYKVYGSETLEDGGNWQYPTNSLHRFFRVKVEMP